MLFGDLKTPKITKIIEITLSKNSGVNDYQISFKPGTRLKTYLPDVMYTTIDHFIYFYFLIF